MIHLLLIPDPEERRFYVESMAKERVHRLDAEEDEEEIAQLLQPALFADDNRAIWIDRVEKLNPSFKELLEGRRIFLSGIRSDIRAENTIDLTKEKKWEKKKRIQQFVQRYLKAAGKTIESKALDALIEGENENLPRIMMEIEKLICFSGESSTIDHQMIESISSLAGSLNEWKLAEQIVFGFKNAPLPPDKEILALLSQLRYQIDIGFTLASSGNIAAEYPHLKGSLLKHYQTLTAALPSSYFAEAKKALFEVEFRAKGIGLSSSMWYVYLLVKLKRLRDAALSVS